MSFQRISIISCTAVAWAGVIGFASDVLCNKGVCGFFAILGLFGALVSVVACMAWNETTPKDY